MNQTRLLIGPVKHRSEQAGEAAVELGASQAQVLAGSLLAFGDHARRGEDLQMVTAGRLGYRKLQLAAGHLPAGFAARNLTHDLEPNGVREGLEDDDHVDL